jgi:hypothetical protein
MEVEGTTHGNPLIDGTVDFGKVGVSSFQNGLASIRQSLTTYTIRVVIHGVNFSRFSLAKKLVGKKERRIKQVFFFRQKRALLMKKAGFFAPFLTPPLSAYASRRHFYSKCFAKKRNAEIRIIANCAAVSYVEKH